METDISYAPATPVQGEEVSFSGLRRPDPYSPEEHTPEGDEGSTPIPQHHLPPPQDYYYYSQPPPMMHTPPTESASKDIFSNMDKNTYILLIIAFVFGFFIGRGMIQPVILRSGST